MRGKSTHSEPGFIFGARHELINSYDDKLTHLKSGNSATCLPIRCMLTNWSTRYEMD